jgi:prophage antirepressor-like protein
MRDMKIFNHKEFGELSILIINGKEYFPASRCAAILGYTNTRDAISRHCRGVVKHDIIDNLGRTQETNFIPEGDLYRLIIRSNLPKAEQFERWVFDEVLPSIRKFGLYATDALIDDILNNPDLGIKLFTEYKQAKERAKQLELETAKQKQIIGELRPKASFLFLS